MQLHSSRAAQEDQKRSARFTGLQHKQQQSAGSPTFRASAEESEPQSDLTMRFATPIPPRFVAGRTLPLPVVVLFGHHTEVVPDTNDIWVFVSLVKEESGGSPQDDLLLGQRADSIHPLPRRDSNEDRHFAYASFANLAISARGRYRFRMTAVDMRSANNRDESGHGGRVLPAITSEAFEVIDPTQPVAAEENYEAALLRLRELGLTK
ncbi:hypothetical protein LTR70_006914 [Exophiala xenobiotica]|uniref:Velvet domain-containing protein n=1 Tax=Lithohypha guttulata TaxID=1690604 RepID=A0ABR0K5Z6_9EURO|nr:hypothetical protein LTR24_006565 [Lithohypha guttulata]KAK5314952.1 hypothetical protein LTR70_006914 [Exophiala xenobiotica]